MFLSATNYACKNYWKSHQRTPTADIDLELEKPPKNTNSRYRFRMQS